MGGSCVAESRVLPGAHSRCGRGMRGLWQVQLGSRSRGRGRSSGRGEEGRRTRERLPVEMAAAAVRAVGGGSGSSTMAQRCVQRVNEYCASDPPSVCAFGDIQLTLFVGAQRAGV